MNKDVFLSLNDASFSIGKKKLLKEISLSIHENDKTALVGKNGVGKTTLLRILFGDKNLDEGFLWKNPRVKAGILSQRDNLKSELNVIDFLLKVNKPEINVDEYNVDRVLNEIKLDKTKKIYNLSGGELRKLALAKLLISEFDLMFLDEPTNHLDIESIEWLESYLTNEFKGSFLVISHNRSFLRNVTNKVLWMDRGLIKISSKGFYNFDHWKNMLIEQERRELKNKKQLLDEEINWLNRGVKARRKRNIKRKDNVNFLKHSYEEDNKAFLRSISKVRISNESLYIDNGPRLLINFIDVEKLFSEEQENIKILNNFNFKLMRGKRIGIIGKNGSGKSTFLNLASNRIEPTRGSVKIKKKVDFSFFDQSGKQFDDKKTIKRNLISSGGEYINVGNKKIHICGYLKNFLFDPRDIERPVSTLSGGERNRLLIAKILASPKEILILDEPTNDLDMETIDLLIDFINLHKGSALICSHDIDFLEKTCHSFFIFDGSGKIRISKHPKLHLYKEDETTLPKHKKKKPISTDKLINKILKKIEEKELYIKNLTEKLQKQKVFDQNSKDYNNIINDLKKAQGELEFLEKEWIEIEERSINYE